MQSRINTIFICLFIMIMAINGPQVLASEINVAVASNFMQAVKKIVISFELQSPHHIKLAFGSTGKHYAQIRNGAPFDMFLAADIRRPKLLEQEKIAVTGSRYTYALGKVVLWSPVPGFVDSEGQVLFQKDIHHIAIANPKLAPYGAAAQEILQHRNLWEKYAGKIVRGENISQTFQFIISGNAELGFVAYSQVLKNNHLISGSLWDIPQSLYKPIAQQVVILKDSPLTREFWRYLKSESARKIIQSFGYGLPE